MFHVEELSCDVERLQARDPRDFAQAFQRLAVAERALRRLPGLSAFDQRFASGDAARWHIGDETGMRIPDFRAERICGDFQDATPNRFGAAIRMELTMAARGGDERLW